MRSWMPPTEADFDAYTAKVAYRLHHALRARAFFEDEVLAEPTFAEAIAAVLHEFVTVEQGDPRGALPGWERVGSPSSQRSPTTLFVRWQLAQKVSDECTLMAYVGHDSEKWDRWWSMWAVPSVTLPGEPFGKLIVNGDAATDREAMQRAQEAMAQYLQEALSASQDQDQEQV